MNTPPLDRTAYAQWVMACDELQLDYLPSWSDFLWIRVAKERAGVVKIIQALSLYGIRLGPVADDGLADLAGWLRVPMGLPADNCRFIDALKAIYAAQPDWWEAMFLQG